jgi:hypothetical protein
MRPMLKSALRRTWRDREDDDRPVRAYSDRVRIAEGVRRPQRGGSAGLRVVPGPVDRGPAEGSTVGGQKGGHRVHPAAVISSSGVEVSASRVPKEGCCPRSPARLRA